MKGRPLITVLVLLAMVTTCFVSAPVISGEHPWDADDPDELQCPGGVDTTAVFEDGQVTYGSPSWWLYYMPYVLGG